MNAPSRKFVTAVAISVFGIAGVACATTSDTAADTSSQATGGGTRTLQPILPQATAGAAATPGTPGSTSAARAGVATSPQNPSTGTSSDTSTTTSTSTMPPSATSGPETATNGANAANSQARKIFDQLDLNHDGSLSFEEFSRATFESK